MKRLLPLLLLAPTLSHAWEDTDLLNYIMKTNPVMRSHQLVVNEYHVSNSWMERIEKGSSFVARATAGGSEFNDISNSTVFGGISISIPLSTENERRERALKQLSRATASDDMKSRILADVAKLRQMEAELESSNIQIKFWKDKLQWTTARVKKGYAKQTDQWNIGQKINSSKASITKLGINIKTQQHILSRYAGEQWKIVLAYIKNKGQLWS